MTEGDLKHTLGIVRQLAGSFRVYTCATRRLSMAGVSRSTSINLRCPPVADSAAWLRWLDAAIRRHRIDQVIPVGHEACALLARHRDRWLPRTRIVLPEASKVDLALDKRATNHLGEALGLSVPRLAQPRSIGDIHACADQVGYPLVIKEAVEGSSDVAYVDDRYGLERTLAAFLARNRWSEPYLPIFQQRIVGPGFGVFATYQDGRCRRIMAHRRIREYPPTGGYSTCAELWADPVLLEHGRRMLDALGWHGVAMVEFKRHDVDGRYYLMEVNPKLWGSLDLALAAGCDFPGDLCAIADGADLPEMQPPTARLRFCWPISGDLPYLVRRPGAWRAVLGDWTNPTVRTNLDWSDPFPHVVELAVAVRGLVRDLT